MTNDSAPEYKAFRIGDLDKYSDWPLQWRYNERKGVSNHQPHDYLLNRRSKTTPKLRVTGLCEGNSPVTGEFLAQKPVTRKNFSIWHWLY